LLSRAVSVEFLQFIKGDARLCISTCGKERVDGDRQGRKEAALRVQTVVRQPTHASSGPAGDRFAVSQRMRPLAAQAG